MIRKAKEEDSYRIAEIQVFGWRTAYRGIIKDQFLFNSLSVVKANSSFLKRIKDNTLSDQIYIFEEDSIIKGFIIFGPYRDYENLSCLELYAIYVEPLMKRNGIGTKMINFFENYARENKYKKTSLWILEENLEGRNFYEKNGYKYNKKRKKLENINVYEVEYEKKL
ncbi:MAG: GNAT family N-acetyltransferase [Spirochaetes bacterium]|nr:GNAT family N-acetyltransferase [Spirochaetota bacterium]